MSWTLGIRDFPILHRQFSSPTTKISSPRSLESSQDLTQDSKDVLIQRLNDLAYRLMNSENLEDEIITGLHIEVDHMEGTIQRIPGSREQSFETKEETTPGMPRTNDDDAFWGPLSPGRNRSMRFQESPTQSRLARPRLQRGREISPNKAASIAREAQNLTERMARTIVEMKKRREETDVSISQSTTKRILTYDSTFMHFSLNEQRLLHSE
jgi:hypothetical protein